MNRIRFFTKPDCSLCRGGWYVLQRVRARTPFDVDDISATGNEAWKVRYGEHIPVVHLNGQEIFRHRVDERRLLAMLREGVLIAGTRLDNGDKP